MHYQQGCSCEHVRFAAFKKLDVDENRTDTVQTTGELRRCSFKAETGGRALKQLKIRACTCVRNGLVHACLIIAIIAIIGIIAHMKLSYNLG